MAGAFGADNESAAMVKGDNIHCRRDSERSPTTKDTESRNTKLPVFAVMAPLNERELGVAAAEHAFLGKVVGNEQRRRSDGVHSAAKAVRPRHDFVSLRFVCGLDVGHPLVGVLWPLGVDQK